MRGAKQIVFGLIILFVVGLIGWGIYSSFFKPAPTCFDNTQNQGETGVDCGGPCVPCELKSLKPIQVDQGWPKWFKTTTSTSGIVAEIYNPNPDWGASNFSYRLDIKDQFGSIIKSVTGASFIYGGELKYLVEPRIDLGAGKISSVDLTISNPQWVSINDFSRPDVEIQDVNTGKTDMLYVSGKVVNRAESDFSNFSVYSLVYNKDGQFLAASKTIVDTVPKFGSSDFKISFGNGLNIYQPISATFIFTKTLAFGDTGSDVGLLQSFLLEGNFLSSDHPITNYFDSATKQALIAMQTAMGLAPTGDFDQATLQTLNSIITANIPAITKLQAAQSVDPTMTKVFVEIKK
jgi:hypothetical protein